MAMELIRELWEYHHWANRRLFDVVAALGDDVAARDLGKHWSVPTILGMLTHVCEADGWWLERWKGVTQAVQPGEDMFFGSTPRTLGALRERWDGVEREQRSFLAGLGETDSSRVVEGLSRLRGPFRRPLGVLLLHVPNHATHHRSEIAAMLTIVAGSPPDTGFMTYYAAKTAG